MRYKTERNIPLDKRGKRYPKFEDNVCGEGVEKAKTFVDIIYVEAPRGD